MKEGANSSRRKMRGTQLLLIVLVLLSQSNLVRERKAEYAHETRAVLSFLDREFWDQEEGGFFSNPYGKPLKLCHEQALVALAHLEMYNATAESRYLERAEEIIDHLREYVGEEGGCSRVISDVPLYYPTEQANALSAFCEAYRTTGNNEYRETYRQIAGFLLEHLCWPKGNTRRVRAWWEGANGTWEEAQTSAVYFETAASLFKAYKVDGNQTYLDAAKQILLGSERFWDQSNYGYVHSKTDSLRYARDHGLATMAYLAAYDVTNRKDYLQRARDILFIVVSRMGDEMSRTFYESVTEKGEIQERRKTADHLLLVRAYIYANRVTYEDKYLRQAEELLDSILNRAYDESSGAFTDLIGGGVMGDLEVQAYGAIGLVEAYRVLRVGASPMIAIVVLSVLVILVGFMAYLFKTSWPY